MSGESHEVLIVRRGRKRTAWCEACRAQVEWLVAEDAAQVARISARSIYRAAEDGTLHSSETPDGRLWICTASLPQVGPPRRLDQEH